jgi:hypothetical protein
VSLHGPQHGTVGNLGTAVVKALFIRYLHYNHDKRGLSFIVWTALFRILQRYSLLSLRRGVVLPSEL